MRTCLAVISFGVVAGWAASAVADHDHGRTQRVFRTQLVGLNEVPSVSTVAKGQFYAIASEDGKSFTFWLSYSGLSFDASMAHIHFGQHHTNGGINVWLCQSNTNPAPAAVAGRVALCPTRATPAPITATITAEDIVGAAQGIAATEIEELLAAMRAGAAYANVHSGVTGNGFPGGEIRGQIN